MWLKILTLLGLCVFSPVIFSFDYFNDEIDYWGEPNSARKTTQKLKKRPKQDKTYVNKKSQFTWSRCLNPKTKEDLKEVFREGNYAPPAPLLELAQNPTRENIKNWLAVGDKKNEIMSRVQAKIAEYLKSQKASAVKNKAKLKSQVSKSKVIANLDLNRFKFRLYFESTCPHCRRMLETVKKLHEFGFYVELRQIDRNFNRTKSLPFPIIPVSNKELQAKKISAWPVLFISDLNKKLNYRINGYQTANDILKVLKSK